MMEVTAIMDLGRHGYTTVRLKHGMDRPLSFFSTFAFNGWICASPGWPGHCTCRNAVKATAVHYLHAFAGGLFMMLVYHILDPYDLTCLKKTREYGNVQNDRVCQALTG